MEASPAIKPTAAADSITVQSGGGVAGIRKSAVLPRTDHLTTVAVALAIPTGIRLRGLHSKRRSSTASITAATGVLNVADIPAAAPATSRVFRSEDDTFSI